MPILLRDLRHGVRALVRAPAFTAVAVATLALGIGPTAAIFTVVHGVLLAPLPHPKADRIVALTTQSASGRLSPRITGGDYVDVQAAPAFEAVSYYYGGQVGVQLPGRAAFAPVIWTTASLFRVFSVAPVCGRLFADAESVTEAVVGEDFANRSFGGALAALGQRLAVEGRAYEIVGVLPRAFRFPRRAEVWAPAGIVPRNLNRTAFNYQAVARVRDHHDLRRAQADLDTIAARLAADLPETNAEKAFLATPLREHIVGSVRPTLYLVFGAVLLLLSIAAANTANLLLARAAVRSREVAVRVSLGATRWNLLRQFLAESVCLAFLGGAAGLAVGILVTGALLRGAPPDLPRADTLSMGWPAVALVGAVSLVTSVLFGIVPVLQARLVDPRETLGPAGGRAIGHAGLHRLRTMLVVGEIGLAFALTATAGLLVRSMLALDAVAVGYETGQRLVMYAHAPARTDEDYVAVTRFFDELLDELRAVPGVVSAASVMGLPGGQYGSNGSYAVEGRHVFEPGRKLPEADFALASGGYFATMEIPLVRGRDFDRRDQHDTLPVAIVSDALVRDGFGGEDPIGKRIVCGLDSPQPMTVVGVVGDVRRHSPARRAGPLLYMPLTQHPSRANEVQVVLHTAARPESMVEPVRRIVAARNAEVAMRFTTVEKTRDDTIATPRFRTVLFVSFGALAMLLAVAGVYGLMSYMAAQRRSEFGVRMALGARPADLVLLMLRGGVRLGALGLAGGLVAAVAAAHLARSLLFEIEPLDAVTFGAAAATLLVATLAGATLPAWRAARVDPVTSIRTD